MRSRGINKTKDTSFEAVESAHKNLRQLRGSTYFEAVTYTKIHISSQRCDALGHRHARAMHRTLSSSADLISKCGI